MASAGHLAHRKETDVTLYKTAVDLLRKNDLQARRALTEFVSEVHDAGGIMAALISRKDTEPSALEYLQRIEKDMRNEKDSRAKRDGGGINVVADGNESLSAPNNSVQAEAKASGASPEMAIRRIPSPTSRSAAPKRTLASQMRVAKTLSAFGQLPPHMVRR